jgi:hypothetical protein
MAGLGSIALNAESSHGVGNGVVQTAIEGSEFADAERRIPLLGKIRDGLAQVAVVVNDLVQRVPELQ